MEHLEKRELRSTPPDHNSVEGTGALSRSTDFQSQRLIYSDTTKPTKALLSFLNEELRPKASHSIEEEYPSLFGSYPGGESLYVEKNNRVVSHVGHMAREFQHALFRFRFGMLGSVITDHRFRGMGMASSLLREALQELRRKGAILALLWSEHTEFYLPLGFHRAGRETDLRFAPERMPEQTGTVREFETQDLTSLWRLYQRHSLKIDRSLEELRALCRIPRTRIFVTERNGILTSYLAVNKGADFEGYIHEWGGELQDLQRNIAHCQRYLLPEIKLTLIAPASVDLGPVKQIAVEKLDGVVGLMKLLDRPKLMATYLDFLKKSNVPFSWGRERDTLKVNGIELPVRTDADCLALIFGDPTHSAHPALPFFVWGFDSI